MLLFHLYISDGESILNEMYLNFWYKVFTVFVPVMTWTVNLVDWNLEVDIWRLWGRQLKILSLQIWQCWCDKYQNSFVQHFEKIARHTCVEDLTKNGQVRLTECFLYSRKWVISELSIVIENSAGKVCVTNCEFFSL